MVFSACYHEAIIINCNHIFNEKTLSISELILLNLLSFHHCQMIASKMKWEQLRPFRNHIVFYHIFYNIPARILQYLKIFDLFLFMKPNIFLQWFQKVDKQTSWVWCVHPFEYSNDWFHTQHIQITIFLYKYWSYSYICWRTLKLYRRLCGRESQSNASHLCLRNQIKSFIRSSMFIYFTSSDIFVDHEMTDWCRILGHFGLFQWGSALQTSRFVWFANQRCQ